MSLAVVRDLRESRAPSSPEELPDFETDVLAGFVLARSAAGLADGTIRSDVGHLDQVRAWFGRPLWEMEPADANAYFGQVLRATAKGTRLGRAQALKTYFLFVELRHKVEIHNLTGRVVECPIDEMNRPRGQSDAALRIPPNVDHVEHLFAGWRADLATCRKFTREHSRQPQRQVRDRHSQPARRRHLPDHGLRQLRHRRRLQCSATHRSQPAADRHLRLRDGQPPS